MTLNIDVEFYYSCNHLFLIFIQNMFSIQMNLKMRCSFFLLRSVKNHNDIFSVIQLYRNINSHIYLQTNSVYTAEGTEISYKSCLQVVISTVGINTSVILLNMCKRQIFSRLLALHCILVNLSRSDSSWLWRTKNDRRKNK